MTRELSEEWLKMGQDRAIFALLRDVVCLLYKSTHPQVHIPLCYEDPWYNFFHSML